MHCAISGECLTRQSIPAAGSAIRQLESLATSPTSRPFAEDRLLRQTEAAKMLAMSVETLRRHSEIPRVARPTNGRKRKVTYLYRLSTLLRLMERMGGEGQA